MNVKIGTSNAVDARTAVLESTSTLRTPKLILFFAPSSRFGEVAAELRKCCANATIIGTTSHYLFSEKGVSVDSVGLVSFEDGIEFSAGVIEEIKRYPMKYAPAVKDAHDAVSHDNTVCFEFTTAHSMSEELVLATLNSICEEYDIPVYGASAGLSGADFASGKESYVSLNGKVYTDASVFFFIHNVKGKIVLVKENVYQPTSTTFTATSVDVKNRLLRELDGRPAVKVLSEVLRCEPRNLAAKLKVFPLARVVGDDLLMSDFNTVFEDGSISCNTRIYNGTKVCLAKPSDYRAITQQTCDKIHTQLKNPSFTFM